MGLLGEYHLRASMVFAVLHFVEESLFQRLKGILSPFFGFGFLSLKKLG